MTADISFFSINSIEIKRSVQEIHLSHHVLKLTMLDERYNRVVINIFSDEKLTFKEVTK